MLQKVWQTTCTLHSVDELQFSFYNSEKKGFVIILLILSEILDFAQ